MEVTIKNNIIPLEIIRKNNKNIYFRICNGNLVVSASPYISEKKILELISKNEESIARMIAKEQEKRLKEAETWLWGKKYCVVYDSNILKIVIDNDMIFVKNEKMLETFFKEEAKRVFKEEADRIKINYENVPNFTLKIRKMKTRWGVCNYVKKTVTLNFDLIKYDKDLLDYVIVHEFAHFTHHDHSKKFWDLVGKYYPEYKKARKELRS